MMTTHEATASGVLYAIDGTCALWAGCADTALEMTEIVRPPQ
jgi:hypothetical protein